MTTCKNMEKQQLRHVVTDEALTTTYVSSNQD